MNLRFELLKVQQMYAEENEVGKKNLVIKVAEEHSQLSSLWKTYRTKVCLLI